MRRLIPRASLLALMLALVAASAPVAVAEPNDVDRAKQHYELGYAALQDGRYEAALEHYMRSYALAPRPRTLFNIAVSEEMLGRLADALRHYQEFVDLAGDRDEDFKAQARAKLDELGKQVQKDVGGATDRPLPVDATAPPPTVTPPPRSRDRPRTGLAGALRVHTNVAGSTVSIDGLVVGTTSASAQGSGAALLRELAPGNHDVIVETPGARTWHRRLHVSPGETVRVDVAFRDTRLARTRALTWTLAGVGALSMAAGGTLGVLALRDVASADAADHARGKTRAMVTDLLIVGGAAALYGAWRLGDRPKTTATVSRSHEGTSP